MKDFEQKDYKIFDIFKNQWALASAGNMEKHNACTVRWGSMGTLWIRPGSDGQIITVYIHPARYTAEFFNKNDRFAVSFFSESYKKSLGYMGSHSGRDGNKEIHAGLTPVEINGTVTYMEAELTFICKKIYAHQFNREDIAEDIREYYKSNPDKFPVDEDGQ